ETNEESEGCVVARLSAGEYLISGCTGLNADAAWGGVDGGFEIPVDRNKQPRIWLDYTVNADGTVLIKTYHRVHA
ncbi:phage tail fiber protein, partial [Citrobacter pasteurii]